MSLWDTPEAAAMAGGDFVSFKDPNSVVGTLAAFSFTDGTDFNGKSCPEATIELDDGEAVRVTMGQANLRTKFREAAPEIGDRVAIAWDGETMPTDKGPMKVFTVETKRASEVAASKPSSLL